MGGLCAPGSWTHVHWIKEEPLEHLRILERGTKKNRTIIRSSRNAPLRILSSESFYYFFFPVQRRNKRVSFHSFRWRPVRHSKVRAVGQVLNILFFFSSSYIRKNIQQRKANGRFRLFSFFSADTYLFFPSARYLSILSIYHSFPIWNIQHDSMHLNQDIYCCVLPFALPNFLAMCHHTADFTCR